jgi:hypothetical protein
MFVLGNLSLFCGEVILSDCVVSNRDFYFRALGSLLVVLSFPQPLSFSSVLPKPLSETLIRSSDGRNPVKLTVPCWQVGPLLVPRSGHASTYPDHRGTRNLSMLARRTHSLPRCPLQNGSPSQPRAHARARAIASPSFPAPHYSSSPPAAALLRQAGDV